MRATNTRLDDYLSWVLVILPVITGLVAYYHLVKPYPKTGDQGIYLKQQLKDKLIEHQQYIDKHSQDLREIRNWKWRPNT